MKFISVALLSCSLIFVLNSCTKVSITEDTPLQKLSVGKSAMTVSLEGDVYDVVRQHTLATEFHQDRLLQWKAGIRRMQQLNVANLPFNQQVAVLGADNLFMQSAYQDLTNTYNYLVSIGKANNTVTGDDLPKYSGTDICIEEYNNNMTQLTKDIINYVSTFTPARPELLPYINTNTAAVTALGGFKDRLIGIQITYRLCAFFLTPGGSGDDVGIDPGPSYDADLYLAEAAKAKARAIDQLVIDAFESYNLGQLDNDPYPVYDNYSNADIAFIITQTYMVHFNRTSSYNMTDIYDYIHSNYQQIALPLTRPLPDFMQPHL